MLNIKERIRSCVDDKIIDAIRSYLESELDNILFEVVDTAIEVYLDCEGDSLVRDWIDQELSSEINDCIKSSLGCLSIEDF